MTRTKAKGTKKAGAAGIGTIVLVLVVSMLLGPEAFRDAEADSSPDSPTSPVSTVGAGGRPSEVSADGRVRIAEAGLDPALRDAIRDHQSEVMVTLDAEVVKVLPDDNDGSRHQRLLLVLDEPVGKVDTILIAHNIDLAERVPCDEGDRLLIRGQYEWNEKGGVIHWTHHDPKKRRESGWIQHAGERYE